MEENMRVSIKMIKNMVMVFLNGLMAVSTREIGKTVNNMEEEFMLVFFLGSNGSEREGEWYEGKRIKWINKGE
jgi:hypothetical protein